MYIQPLFKPVPFKIESEALLNLHNSAFEKYILNPELINAEEGTGSKKSFLPERFERKKIISNLHNHWHIIILFLGIFFYILYFSSASIARYDNFYTGRFDLGNMDQTVWNTKSGWTTPTPWEGPPTL